MRLGEGVEQDTERAFGIRVHKRRRDLAMTKESHGATVQPTARGNAYFIHKAAVSFHERKKPLVALRQIKFEQFGGVQVHPHAKHLTWAKIVAERCGVQK